MRNGAAIVDVNEKLICRVWRSCTAKEVSREADGPKQESTASANSNEDNNKRDWNAGALSQDRADVIICGRVVVAVISLKAEAISTFAGAW